MTQKCSPSCAHVSTKTPYGGLWCDVVHHFLKLDDECEAEKLGLLKDDEQDANDKLSRKGARRGK